MLLLILVVDGTHFNAIGIGLMEVLLETLAYTTNTSTSADTPEMSMMRWTWLFENDGVIWRVVGRCWKVRYWLCGWRCFRKVLTSLLLLLLLLRVISIVIMMVVYGTAKNIFILVLLLHMQLQLLL
jgi:hypothetical protein